MDRFLYLSVAIRTLFVITRAMRIVYGIHTQSSVDVRIVSAGSVRCTSNFLKKVKIQARMKNQSRYVIARYCVGDVITRI